MKKIFRIITTMMLFALLIPAIPFLVAVCVHERLDEQGYLG